VLTHGVEFVLSLISLLNVSREEEEKGGEALSPPGEVIE